MILLLLILCHFVADFTHLSTPWMLSAKAYGKPIFPIACHGAIHGVLCGFVSLNIWVSLIVFSTHTLIDIAKGRINAYNVNLMSTRNIYHWYVFGADQFLHVSIIASCYLIFIQ